MAQMITNSRRIFNVGLPIAAVVVLLLLPAPAAASLGGDGSTVDRDRVQMRGSLVRIMRADTHVMHEMRTPSGVLVREYVSSTGTVFAVSWQGAWTPDLQQVLGTYYARYVQRAQEIQRTRRSRGPVSVQDNDFVIQVSGHQRSFSGVAYLPGRLPAGFNFQSVP
jgi:hypothetical protein